MTSMKDDGKLQTYMTEDGGARLLFANTCSLVGYAAERHKPSRTVTAALGRCLSAAALMGGTLKDEDSSITLRIAGDGPAGSFTCVADGAGRVRGCCENPSVELPANAAGKLDVGGVVGHSGDLYVVRDDGFGEPYVGYTRLVSGEIAEDVTSYYAISEQVPTVCALGVRLNEQGGIRGAGGFLLQLMPGAEDALIDALQSRVEVLPSLSALIAEGKTGEDISGMLFGDIPYRKMGEKSFRYECSCSREKYRAAVKSIGIQELREMRDSGEEAEIICRFCGERYAFSGAELAEMCAEREAELRRKAAERSKNKES